MNSRAQVPEAALILITLSICVISLYYAVSFKEIAPSTISIEKASQMFSDIEKSDFYTRDFANIALSESYAEVAAKPISCNEQIGVIPVWSDLCRPNNQEIKNKIKLKFDEKFAAAGKFSSEIKDKLDVEIQANWKISDENKFMSYNISYNQPLLLSLDYPAIDFEQVYSQAISKKSECYARFASNTEADKDVKIARCLEELRPGGWNAAVTSIGNYYSFTLTSSKSYFYGNSFKPAELKFALKKT